MSGLGGSLALPLRMIVIINCKTCIPYMRKHTKQQMGGQYPHVAEIARAAIQVRTFRR